MPNREKSRPQARAAVWGVVVASVWWFAADAATGTAFSTYATQHPPLAGAGLAAASALATLWLLRQGRTALATGAATLAVGAIAGWLVGQGISVELHRWSANPVHVLARGGNMPIMYGIIGIWGLLAMFVGRGPLGPGERNAQRSGATTTGA